MVQSGAKHRGKSIQIKAETWQRARDLVAAGRMSLREISRELGITHSTLLRRKEKEGWFDPRKEIENIPDPPPSLTGKSKKTSKSGEADSQDPYSIPLSEPPKQEIFKDTLSWCQNLLGWALDGVARRAQHSIVAQCFLVEKLPNVMKSLALSGPAGGTAEEQAAALRAEIEDRLANIQPPEMREFDRGQEPEKQRDGKS